MTRGTVRSAARKSLGLLSLVTIVAHAVALHAQTAPAGEPASRPFVRVEGTRFLIGDQPFFFVGANLHVMHDPVARGAMEQTMAAAAADGLTVGRVWALGEDLVDAPTWKKRDFLFRAGPDGWQDSAYEQLDRVIAEAGKHGLRLVITLSNQWADFGGIPMYLRWAKHFDQQSYGFLDRFFSDPQIKAWFWAHIERIITRRNSVTGVLYRDDPTIMTWELQNELRGTPEAAAARRQWAVEMTRKIRAIDPNHLVVPGVIGYDLQLERDNWIAMNELPEVAYCSQHVYPESQPRSSGLANLHSFIDDRVQLAHHVIGKPIVFGEFGFSALDNAPAVRARWHSRFIERVFFNGGNGAMVWIYQPTLPWPRRYGVVIDHPRDLPLRRALAARAAQARRGAIRARNPRLGPSQGRKNLAPTHALARGRAQPHRAWQLEPERNSWRLDMAVDEFSRSFFENSGTWDGGVLVHFYGRRTGWVEYAFRSPPGPVTRIDLRFRASSEFPGMTAPPDGFSEVMVQIDARPLATVRVIPDDGMGQWVTLTISDPVWLKRLRGGVHRLRFSVAPGSFANGVALYGRETPLNREPVVRPGPLQLRVYGADSAAGLAPVEDTRRARPHVTNVLTGRQAGNYGRGDDPGPAPRDPP